MSSRSGIGRSVTELDCNAGYHCGMMIVLRCRWLFLLLLLITVGCGSPAQTVASASVVEALSRGQGDFALATAPQPFVFPRDHGPHPDYRTEWWYYTGNLMDDAGRPYGYQLTFFRNALTAEMPARSSDLATNQFYMAHFALTSQLADRHVSFERFSRGAGGLAGASGEPAFEVWLEDWAVRQTEPGVYLLNARAGEGDDRTALTLTLRETRPVVLHGDAGLSQKGPELGNANYYYSLVGLASNGELTFAGEVIPVTGLSWMDHEYGTSSLSGEIRGWNWFAVQLENGMAFMFGEFHDGLGNPLSVYAGTLVYADGRQATLTDADFEVETLRQWISPVTGLTYPAAWRVHFPQHGIELTIEPIVADQEMDVSFVYYEGATQVSAQVEGETVNGVGYVELTGYSDRTGYQR